MGLTLLIPFTQGCFFKFDYKLCPVILGNKISKSCQFFRRWLHSHASIAVAFSDLVIMNMLIAGTKGPLREILQRLILSFFMTNIDSCIFETDFQFVLMTNVLLKFNFVPITNNVCKTLFH